MQVLPCSSDKFLSSRLSSANLPLNFSWKGMQSHSPVVLDGQPLARPPRLLGGGAPVVSLPGHELQAACHRLHGVAFNERKGRIRTQGLKQSILSQHCTLRTIWIIGHRERSQLQMLLHLLNARTLTLTPCHLGARLEGILFSPLRCSSPWSLDLEA